MAQIHSVNVIEFVNNSIDAVYAFTDDEQGNIEAEAIFIKLATKAGLYEEDCESCLDDGFYKSEFGSYQVFITHAMGVTK